MMQDIREQSFQDPYILHQDRYPNRKGVYLMKQVGVFSTYTLAALLVSGSMAIAAGPSGQKSATSDKTQGSSSQQEAQSGSQKSQQQMSATPVMGTRASTTIFAAVHQVNEEEKTITLIGSDGSKMEMEVPEQAMSQLQQGDIVEVSVDKLTAVSIDKVQDAQQSATSGNAQGTQQKAQQRSPQSAQQSTQSSDRMNAQSAQSRHATPATVESVDTQAGKLTLQMEKSGKTVEMQAPEELLSNLERGDSVEVTIRKSQHSPASDSPTSKPQSK
jgi:Cu/Ag efflux protein CusF